MKVNLSEEHTEAGWQDAFDRFWIAATPKWFEWMGWILVLAALKFVVDESASLLLRFVYAFSYIAVIGYFQGWLYSIQFEGLPLIKSERAKRLVSLLISAVLVIFVWLAVTAVVNQLQGKL